VTVSPTTAGVFTNIAFSSASTFDPNPANNNGSAAGSFVTTTVVSNTPAQFGIQQGANVFNPQTGLFEQSVTVTNAGASTVAAVRLLVGGLRPNVMLYNAAGTNGARPYVQFNAPLNPSEAVVFLLEFYVPDRQPFTNSLEAQAVLPPASTNLTGGIVVDRVFVDTRSGNPRLVIEWASIPGRTYTVIYSDNSTGPWLAATPTIIANANRTQWYDDGPPKTASTPVSVSSRFYRVILAP
jgi:hypothetical protein